mgnify:CR=1 FL=1
MLIHTAAQENQVVSQTGEIVSSAELTKWN